MCLLFFFFQAEDGIRDDLVTGVQTCALPISIRPSSSCPYLWPKWTPRETLRFVGAAFGGRGQELEGRIDAELVAFELTEVSSERNETLSHGTRQRVALAQAFLHDPSVLVLDEPMVGLDPLAQRGLSQRLRAHAAKGAAVLLTTHQLVLAEE